MKLANQILKPSDLRNSARGAKSRAHGEKFEREIDESIEAYRNAGIAWLHRLPIPTVPCGIRHPKSGIPLRIHSGKSPFDVYGLTNQHAPHRPGLFLAAELKYTEKYRSALPLIQPGDKNYVGLQLHQMMSLLDVAAYGGVVRLVWDNGGKIGVLDGPSLVALIAETPKSIPWEHFTIAPLRSIGSLFVPDWLRMI